MKKVNKYKILNNFPKLFKKMSMFLVYCDDVIIRHEVAKHNYRLDILVNDKEWEVRMKVAIQGYGLDILIDDEDWAVRSEVAEKGYKLDKLVHDPELCVREIAKSMEKKYE